MTWFKVDDRFWGHPKVAQLSLSRWYHEAIAVWVLSGSWAGSALTDGFIPSQMLTVFRAKPRAAEALCSVGLWERVPGGFRFVDWADYQPTSAQVKHVRAQTRTRVQRFREGRRNAVTEAVTAAVTERVANGVCTHSLNPIPLRDLDERDDLRTERARSERAPAPARVWDSATQSSAFRAAWLKARKVEPSMFGRNVADFAQRVLATAEARQVDPAQLFGAVLRRYLATELNERELGSPYACFAQRWGALVDAPGEAHVPDDLRAMQAALDESARRVNGGAHGR